MNYTYEITNEKLFNSKVSDVEISMHKGDWTGDVGIVLIDEESRYFSGEHGSRDYEEEYEFIIVKQ